MSTATQILLLLLLVAAVASVGFLFGRQSRRNPDATSNPSTGSGGMPTPIALPPNAPSAPDVDARSARDPIAPPRAGASTRSAPARPTPTSGRVPAVASWGYQLQKPKLQHLADSPFDLIVIDYAKDGGDDSAFTPGEIARLKQKPDGSRRLVVAYLSIGEAESYRGYWQAQWKKQKPAWLLKENPEWKENYAVCFWDPGWQAIMCGTPQARLDRILAAGFDGVYLDKCDVFEDMRAHRMPEAKARPDLESDMVAFVTRLSGYAKAKRPDFLVIMQNTEVLLERAELRRVLDGVGKEELVYGVENPEKKNSRDEFDFSRERLDLMKRDGKMVLCVEYLNNAGKIDDAVRTITSLGFVPYISDKSRELDKLHAPPLIA